MHVYSYNQQLHRRQHIRYNDYSVQFVSDSSVTKTSADDFKHLMMKFKFQYNNHHVCSRYCSIASLTLRSASRVPGRDILFHVGSNMLEGHTCATSVVGDHTTSKSIHSYTAHKSSGCIFQPLVLFDIFGVADSLLNAFLKKSFHSSVSTAKSTSIVQDF